MSIRSSPSCNLVPINSMSHMLIMSEPWYFVVLMAYRLLFISLLDNCNTCLLNRLKINKYIELKYRHNISVSIFVVIFVSFKIKKKIYAALCNCNGYESLSSDNRLLGIALTDYTDVRATNANYWSQPTQNTSRRRKFYDS